MNDPSIFLEQFSLNNFDFNGNRFNISLNGSYANKELRLNDVEIFKTGSYGVYNSGEQSVKIKNAYFSEDGHNASIVIKNLFFLSKWNATITYSMERDNYDNKIYTLNGKKMKINNRKIPDFSTIGIDDNRRITLLANNHGLSGDILRAGSSYVFNTSYLYEGAQFLNGYGEYRDSNLNMFLVSDEVGIEIFELFNVIFDSIESVKGRYFTIDNKRYTLYSHITGDIKNLQVNGRFVGRGTVKSQYFRRTFDDTNVDLRFEGSVLRIANLSLLDRKEQYGVVMVGSSDFINNTLDNMDFRLVTVSDGSGLFFLANKQPAFLNANANFNIFKTRGPVKLDLLFTGSIRRPEISGDVYIINNDIEFTISPTTRRYTSSIYGPAHYLYWDLRVYAISKVQVNYNLLGDIFLEENALLLVRNNQVNGIELIGQLNFTRGNIYYVQNVYTVEDGSIEFTEQNSLDPLINLTSYTKKRYYSSGIPYDVTLYMELVNARLLSLIGNVSGPSSPIRFYTIPALSTYEVYQLAGIPATSIATTEQASLLDSDSIFDDDDQIRGVLSSYSDLLLRNVAIRPIERWVRQFFGIDYIGLNTEILDELIFEETNDDFDINRYFDGTSVSLGKYVTRDLFLKYTVTYESTVATELLTTDDREYAFTQQFGFEINLLPEFKLANLVFEYNIYPFETEKDQDFSIKTRWRF